MRNEGGLFAVIGSLLSLWAKRGKVSEFILAPVIPAKAGIQTFAAKFAIRNQVQIAVIGSPLPLWERARARVRRAQARLCGRDARAPRASPNVARRAVDSRFRGNDGR